MKRLSFVSMGLILTLGGCVLLEQYQSDSYDGPIAMTGGATHQARFGSNKGNELVRTVAMGGTELFAGGDFIGAIGDSNQAGKSLSNSGPAFRAFVGKFSPVAQAPDIGIDWLVSFGDEEGRALSMALSPQSLFVGLSLQFVGNPKTAEIKRLNRMTGVEEAKFLFGSTKDGVTALAINALSSVYAAVAVGDTAWTFTCDGNAVFAPGSLAIVKINGSSMVCEWAATYEGGGASFGAPAMAIDEVKGIAVVALTYQNTVTRAGTQVIGIPPSVGLATAMVALDVNTGQEKWAKGFPMDTSTDSATSTSMAYVDNQGFALTGSVSGHFHYAEAMPSAVIDFTTSGPESEPFHLMVDSNGAMRWAYRLGAANDALGTSIVQTTSKTLGSNLLVSGISVGAMATKPNSDDTVLCPDGGLFLMRVSPSDGMPNWTMCYGNIPEPKIGFRNALLATDDTGVLLSGSWKGKIGFNDGVLDVMPGVEDFDFVLAKFSAVPP